MKFVGEAWRGLNVQGWATYFLKEKLKNLLKIWNKKEFGSLQQKQKEFEEMSELDKKRERQIK